MAALRSNIPTWGLASISLGVAVYLSDDVTFKNMVQHCEKTTDDGKKQLSSGPACTMIMAYLLFKFVITIAAVESALVVIEEIVRINRNRRQHTRRA